MNAPHSNWAPYTSSSTMPKLKRWRKKFLISSRPFQDDTSKLYLKYCNTISVENIGKELYLKAFRL